MTPSRSETTINLQKWNHGQREGLESLLKRHLPWIRERVHYRLGDKLRSMEETGDIVQDAMTQFLRYSPKFVISNSKQFRALVVKILDNVLRDKNDWYSARRRDIARNKPLPPDTILNLDLAAKNDNTPSQSIQRKEKEAWIRLGIEFLEPDDRKVIVLRQWEELSFPEISQRIGKNKDTIRQRYNKAVIKLSKMVGYLRHGELDILLDQ